MGNVNSAVCVYRTHTLQKRKKYKQLVFNHSIIDRSDASPCSKELQHYFEVINSGKVKTHTDNLPKLLYKIKRLNKSHHEQLCYYILKKIDEITMQQLINYVSEWDINKFGCITQMQMILLSDNWSKTNMLGQLWLLYLQKI